MMTRHSMVRQLQESSTRWDLVVVGGGATGMGVAVDAASRGYRVALVDQHDFGKGTSSRSTKLIHGGVRYLQQGNLTLVLEALKERGVLRTNAPHLVRDLRFVVPNYDWWEAPFYGVGLQLYDALAGQFGFGSSRRLSSEETLTLIPRLAREGLRGGVLYHDGQFDDARLLMALLRTAVHHGAVASNYVRATSLVKNANGFVAGVEVVDELEGTTFEIHAKVVVNATGAFVDTLRSLDDPLSQRLIAPSQGVHLVLPRSFLGGSAAIMVPRTSDGRVMFAIPWLGRTLVGTTDTAITEVTLEPKAQASEIEFLLETAGQYLEAEPTLADILSVFAGIRPLVRAQGSRTADLSREHNIEISRSGLITVAGGKWTTYRKMARDIVDAAITLGPLPDRRCVTKKLRLVGYQRPDSPDQSVSSSDSSQTFEGEQTIGLANWPANGTVDYSGYGSDVGALRAIDDARPHGSSTSATIHPRLEIPWSFIHFGVREELAVTLEDLLARRTRALLLDARAAMEAAPWVARQVQSELGWTDADVERETETFIALARSYLPVD